MDRIALLSRLMPVLIATVPCGLLVCGCGSTTSDEFRPVSAADVEQESDVGAKPVPSAAVPAESTELTTTSDVDTPASGLESAQTSNDTSEPDLAEGYSKPTPQEANGPAIIPSQFTSEESTRGDTDAGLKPIDVPLAESSPATPAGTDPLAKPIKLLVPDQTFSVEGPNGALRIFYDDFDIEKVLNVAIPPPDIVKHFPDWLKGLDGKRVRVRGFMYPTFQETDLGGFVLARDYGVCCFGPQGKIYHLVEVAMREGETTDYIHARPFDVVGEFHIRPDADGEELLQLYQIEDAIVIDD